MNAAGFSFALGAFIAGLVLSESDFSHQALSDVVPLRDIFGLMFFVTVGMLFDPRYLIEHIGLIIWVVAAIILGKAVIFGGIARAFGYRNMAPWLIGLGLSQIGEFSFVLARTGMSDQLISKPVYDLILTATVISMAISPMLSAAAIPLGRRWQKSAGPKPPIATKMLPTDSALENHVIVGGYGRAGQAAAFALREANIPCLIVELKSSRLIAATDDGFPTLLGDITQEEILKAAQILEAKMILLTTPDHAAIDLTIRRARALNPHIVLVARSTKLHHVAELRDLGVSVIVQPELEGGLEMVRQSLIHYGRDEEESARIVSHLRTEVYGANEEQPTS
jgi:CPA2 family monovalent cation:H+ antiporter-2